MALIVNIDPAVADLLRRYQQYVGEVDELEGSLNELVEGAVVASLDGNYRFRRWCERESKEVSAI